MATAEPKEADKGPAPEGPDGGWGWVLVGALFVCNSLVFGLMRSSGIFFVEFVQYFDESAQSISWISSIGLATQQFISELWLGSAGWTRPSVDPRPGPQPLRVFLQALWARRSPTRMKPGWW